MTPEGTHQPNLALEAQAAVECLAFDGATPQSVHLASLMLETLQLSGSPVIDDVVPPTSESCKISRVVQL